MPISRLSLFFLVLFFTSLTAISKNQLEKWIDSKKFNLELFNKEKKKKENSYSYNAVDQQGNQLKITLIDDAENYVEFIESIGTPFVVEKRFNKINLNLVNQSQRFYTFEYGYTSIYDDFGNLINRVDHETNFQFSISDLHDLMLNKYNIDIYKISENKDANCIVQRSVNPSIYNVKIPIQMLGGKSVVKDGIRQDLYVIDGNSGEVLSSPDKPSKQRNEMIDLLKRKTPE